MVFGGFSLSPLRRRRVEETKINISETFHNGVGELAYTRSNETPSKKRKPKNVKCKSRAGNIMTKNNPRHLSYNGLSELGTLM